MVNINLENSIREFVSACYLSRQDIKGQSSRLPCLLTVLEQGGRANLNTLTGLSHDEIMIIIKDELVKIAIAARREQELEAARLGKRDIYENRSIIQ
ncbi:hypothetical protein [Shewanella sp. M-Br]|uniref:hypothetical protein n=1 Tax=Shewanella sp. M-Br TaxID=2495595 RepID=UPI00294971E5|nr:hypothetical protein SMBr_32780 [Shewanella sp. M-Br]